MTAYEPENWHDLFVAMAGAAAALAGLLFVAVSINLADILKYASLPRRALEALLIMLSVVLVSIFALVPDQPQILFGVELAAVGLVFLLVTLIPRIRLPREPAEHEFSRVVVPIVGLILTFVPTLVAGVSLVLGAGGGLYWLVATMVFSFVSAITTAWVLLVEILR